MTDKNIGKSIGYRFCRITPCGRKFFNLRQNDQAVVLSLRFMAEAKSNPNFMASGVTSFLEYFLVL